MDKCEYCKSNTERDHRGNCSACGTPIKADIIIPSLSEWDKHPVSDVYVSAST